MKGILILFLVIFAFSSDLPIPLEKSSHQKIYQQYYKQILNNLDHNSKQATQFKQKYCHIGLSEACGDVGIEYMLGFSLPKNNKKAIKFIEFAVENSVLPSQKIAYQIALEIAKSISSKSELEMIPYIKETAWDNREKCVKNGNECATALAYFYLLPYSSFGFKNENELLNEARKLYRADKSGFLLDISAEILLYSQIFDIKF